MNETDFRSAIVAEAETWIGTPYHSEARIKGVGVNCAQFLYGVAKSCGAIAADAPEPRKYTAQLAVHSKEERLLNYIKSYGAVEIEESQVKSGDIVVYKTGSARGHAAIVIAWPVMIHVLHGHGCQFGDVNEGIFGGKARTYLTLWKEN